MARTQMGISSAANFLKGISGQPWWYADWIPFEWRKFALGFWI
jgi:hypothetical protein